MSTGSLNADVPTTLRNALEFAVDCDDCANPGLPHRFGLKC